MLVHYKSHNFNVHRYAFTPLIDDSDDEEIEEFVASTNFGTVTCKCYFHPECCKRLESNSLFVFLYYVLSSFFFTADGVKLRASKSETNGTAKPAETNPVSNTTAYLVWNSSVLSRLIRCGLLNIKHP